MDRALGNGIVVRAWTFDEGYGRDGAFLDGVQRRGQAYVGEVPTTFHGWLKRPRVLEQGRSRGRGRKKKYPRLASGQKSREVRNLARYSPRFRQRSWQRYRIKDTHKGAEVWEVKWSEFWRPNADGLPGVRHCLLVARNVRTREVKYFVSNRVPGQRGIGVRWLLRVAFGRWSVESCFRQAKEELGLDHYEVRGWRCVHRHFYLVQLSQLFCARMRQKYAGPDEAAPGEVERHREAESMEAGRLTMEQVRRAVAAWLEATLGGGTKTERLQRELARQDYYRRRNAQAQKSHAKTRRALLKSLGIDQDRIKSCGPRPSIN